MVQFACQRSGGHLRRHFFLFSLVSFVGLGVVSWAATRVFGRDAFNVGMLVAAVLFAIVAKEWPAAVTAAADLGIELPPFAPVGALFTLDAETSRVAQIAPLGLSTLHRRSRYLGRTIASLRADPDAAIARAVPDHITAALIWHGPTLELPLVRAAQGYVVWGDIESARLLLTRAKHEGRPRCRWTRNFLNGLATIAADARKAGHDLAANRLTAARSLWDDAALAELVDDETRRTGFGPNGRANRH